MTKVLHKLIKWLDKEISESNGLGGTIALDNCRTFVERLIEEEEARIYPITDEDIEFMQQCNMYPSNLYEFFGNKNINVIKIMTENSEGAILEPNDLLKLSDILFRYVKSAAQ